MTKALPGGLRPCLLLALSVSACSRAVPPAGGDAFDAAPDPRAAPLSLLIERAEDRRRARDVPLDAQSSRDPAVRRLAARAFARILGDDDAPLLRALEDDDREAVAWAAYGLGESCGGHEGAHVRALASRLASLEGGAAAGSLDPQVAIVRALGRCGGELAEHTLRASLGLPSLAANEAAAYALGDISAHRGSMSVESAVALLDAAERALPLDAALYPFGRVDPPAGTDLAHRLGAAARAALARPGPGRVFAVRVLGKAGDATADLARVLASNDYSPTERVEAARGLGHVRETEQAALAQAIGAILVDGAASASGDRFEVLLTAIGAVSDDPPGASDAVLSSVARMGLASGAPLPAARRVSSLRCAAAQKLARGECDAPILVSCDVADGAASERARLAAFDRGSLVKAKAAAFVALARGSPHVRVREAAVEAIGRHPELAEAGRALLAEALGAREAGVVATAATVLATHPERSRLNPARGPSRSGPPPDVDPRVTEALRSALDSRWGPDLVETRAALLDAALALGLDEARARATDACGDPNATVRARAAKALAASGLACPPPGASGLPSDEAAPEIGRTLVRAVRVVFETDAGALGISFDPVFAPVAATRFVALARSGFYTLVTVHRVVPGFVVQLGDRGGDGFGGSGGLLRCETSPVPFAPLDVGVALAGRDTGSSQLFVTLGRFPSLDGEYAWVGKADGDWNAVAEGDSVQRVRVEE
jgi:cyclophilin family peptidyl-prolyl cis-trans isomerase